MASTTQEDVDPTIKKAFENGGLGAVQRFAFENIDLWKKEHVKIGITGRTGSGKSSFINAYRGIQYDDEEGAAKVGVTQTTMEATPYQDPNNPNIVLYDLPGVGTKEFPRSEYLQNPKVGLNNYEFIIIITATRFTDDDLWLYKKMAEVEKPVFLVRTKVLNDAKNLQNTKRDYAKKTIEAIIDELRKVYTDEMRGERPSPDAEELPDAEKLPDNVPVYFIDSHEREHPNLDFSILIKAIVEKAPIAKKEAILFSMRVNSTELLKEKVTFLNGRRKYVALCSGAAALVPVPGLSATVDFALVKREVDFYKQQLGLDDAGVEREGKVAKILKIWHAFNIDQLKVLLMSEGAENFSKFVIPGLGFIIASSVSAGTTYLILGKLLHRMEDDALKINKIFLENLSNK